jgi:hypothetical protein
MVTKFEGWLPFGRGRRRWENIKPEFKKKYVVGEVEWINATQQKDKL